MSELNDVCEEKAAGIINTYNYDLAGAIINIAAETPTANRNTYAKRLLEWEAKRLGWKKPQIALDLEMTGRKLAQQYFYFYNNLDGVAVLVPKKAVCPVCQGWVQRGEVPIREAMNHPLPYHPWCPHTFATRPLRWPKEECPVLWMGE